MHPIKPILHMFIHDIACQLWPHYVAIFADLGRAADVHAHTRFGDGPALIGMHIGPASEAFERFRGENSEASIKISASFVNQARDYAFLDGDIGNNSWFRHLVRRLEYDANRLVVPPPPFPEAIRRDECPNVTVTKLLELIPAQ